MGAAPWLAGLLILAAMLLIALGLHPGSTGVQWFLRLKRPARLSFERWIPWIWIVINGCFYASALISWNQSQRWDLLGGYLLLFLLVQSEVLVICKTRRIRNGTAVGLLGWVWGIAVAIAAAQVSSSDWLLLLPFSALESDRHAGACSNAAPQSLGGDAINSRQAWVW